MKAASTRRRSVGILGRVEERGAHADEVQRIHLVLHQGDERGDDDAGARAHQRGDLIAQRLAAAGGHQHEGVAAGDDVLDDLALLAAEARRSRRRGGARRGPRSCLYCMRCRRRYAGRRDVNRMLLQCRKFLSLADVPATLRRRERLYDIAVVGAGIVGLAVAREILLRRPGLRVVIFDREDSVAAHQTGHNSGVIHSGIYYTPGSLKARLCVEGSRLMYAYCVEHEIPYERCGKLIVAATEAELPQLDALEARGRANGVPGLRRVSAEEIVQIEPECRGVSALYSPNTGIVDYRAVARSLEAELRSLGAEFKLGCRVSALRRRGSTTVLTHDGGHTGAGWAIACAGLWSDRLAEDAGAPADPRIIPFRGAYLRLQTGSTAGRARPGVSGSRPRPPVPGSPHHQADQRGHFARTHRNGGRRQGRLQDPDDAAAGSRIHLPVARHLESRRPLLEDGTGRDPYGGQPKGLRAGVQCLPSSAPGDETGAGGAGRRARAGRRPRRDAGRRLCHLRDARAPRTCATRPLPPRLRHWPSRAKWSTGWKRT